MSRAVVRKAAFLILLLWAAGGIACTSSSESPFYSKFSLKELVQRISTTGGLNCSSGGGGGGGVGIVAGGIGTGQSHFHKGESFSCQIADVEQFDEAKFLQALKENLEKDLGGSKAKIVSSKNTDATRFYLEYVLEEIRGRVEISGTRSPGNYYNLNAELDENNESK